MVTDGGETRRFLSREVYEYDRVDLKPDRPTPEWLGPVLAAGPSMSVLMLLLSMVPRILARTVNETTGEQVLFLGERDTANITGLDKKTLFHASGAVVEEAARFGLLYEPGRPRAFTESGAGEAGSWTWDPPEPDPVVGNAPTYVATLLERGRKVASRGGPDSPTEDPAKDIDTPVLTPGGTSVIEIEDGPEDLWVIPVRPRDPDFESPRAGLTTDADHPDDTAQGRGSAPPVNVPKEIVEGLLSPASDRWKGHKSAWRACVSLLDRYGYGPAEVTAAEVGEMTGSGGTPESVTRAGRRAVAVLRDACLLTEAVTTSNWVFDVAPLVAFMQHTGMDAHAMMLTPGYAQQKQMNGTSERKGYAATMAGGYGPWSKARERMITEWLEHKPALLEDLRSGATDAATLLLIRKVEAVQTRQQVEAFLQWPIGPAQDRAEATSDADSPGRAHGPIAFRRLRTTPCIAPRLPPTQEERERRAQISARLQGFADHDYRAELAEVEARQVFARWRSDLRLLVGETEYWQMADAVEVRCRGEFRDNRQAGTEECRQKHWRLLAAQRDADEATRQRAALRLGSTVSSQQPRKAVAPG